MVVCFWKNKRGLGEGPLVKNFTPGVTQGFTRGFTKDFTEDFTKVLLRIFVRILRRILQRNLIRSCRVCSARREGAQAPDASPIFKMYGEKIKILSRATRWRASARFELNFKDFSKDFAKDFTKEFNKNLSCA